MLEVDDLHAYYGKSHVLQGVSFHVASGETAAGRGGDFTKRSRSFVM